jgi:hypothetical protein
MARRLHFDGIEVTLRWDRTAFIAITWVLAACSSGEMGNDDLMLAPGDMDTTGATGDTDGNPPTDDETPSDTGGGGEPAWWSVDAELVVSAGALDAGESTWRVTLWAEDETELPCTFDVPIEDAATEAAPALEAGTIASWWGIDLGDTPASDGCPVWPASQIQLGLGPYDGRLDAAADAHEWLDLDLYGLYLQLAPADPVLVVGVAGTEEQFQGMEGAVIGALPDGTYLATTLVLLAL